MRIPSRSVPTRTTASPKSKSGKKPTRKMAISVPGVLCTLGVGLFRRERRRRWLGLRCYLGLSGSIKASGDFGRMVGFGSGGPKKWPSEIRQSGPSGISEADLDVAGLAVLHDRRRFQDGLNLHEEVCSRAPDSASHAPGHCCAPGHSGLAWLIPAVQPYWSPCRPTCFSLPASLCWGK